ncbi:MAG: hypothetical protein BMS9Abin37_1247 [Acidobacteriota bacterium]|nr:MAG: hypothetical protein BMS9Abin37_1247 [Acidobacteriota bacterium]
MIETTALADMIDRYKADAESVYNTWFVGAEERLKAFRAIRCGVRDTIADEAFACRIVFAKDQRGG